MTLPTVPKNWHWAKGTPAGGLHAWLEQARTLINAGGLDSTQLAALQSTLDQYEAGVDATDLTVSALVNDPTDTRAALRSSLAAIASTATLRIPTDYPTLQAAIDSVDAQHIRRGLPVVLQIEAGHQPTAGVNVHDGDFSMFRIEAVDPVVTVAPGFTGDFLYAEHAQAPVLDCLIDMNFQGGSGYYLYNNSSGKITAGSGVRNAGYIGLYLNSSRAEARNCVFTGSMNRNLWATGSSSIDAEAGNFSANTGGDVAIYISKGSNACLNYVTATDAFQTGLGVVAAIASAREIDVSRAGGNGVTVQHGGQAAVREMVADNVGGNGIRVEYGGQVSAYGAHIASPGQMGVHAVHGGDIAAFGATITGAGLRGANAESGGKVTVRNATITGSAATDLYVNTGGILAAYGCTTTAGTPARSNSNVDFNTVVSQGIIFA